MSTPRPAGCWEAYTPGNSWPSPRSPAMTTAEAPDSRRPCTSGSYIPREAPATRRVRTKCSPMSAADGMYGTNGASGVCPAVVSTS